VEGDTFKYGEKKGLSKGGVSGNREKNRNTVVARGENVLFREVKEVEEGWVHNDILRRKPATRLPVKEKKPIPLGKTRTCLKKMVRNWQGWLSQANHRGIERIPLGAGEQDHLHALPEETKLLP